MREAEKGSHAMRYNLVGLTGYARSGKDTAAQVLINDGFNRVAFADPMKNMLYALNPIVVECSELRVREIVDATVGKCETVERSARVAST
jgi:dephospho-CoA kinase